MKEPESEPQWPNFENAPKEGPLAPFAGAVPPAPDWFAKAIAVQPERTFVDVDGAAIESLAWGERGKPGLLFMHGNMAHADWYSFIAPFFAERFRVAALTWSGMGGSGWRERYDVETLSKEAIRVAEEAGLFDAAEKPVFLAHSFGGLPLRWTAIHHGKRLKAAIVLDSRTDMMGRQKREDGEPHRWGPPNAGARTKGNNVYPTLAAALARFRLAPPQSCENHFLVDYIARRSLKEAPMLDGSGMGWTWKFDPFFFGKFNVDDPDALTRDAQCPMAMIWGARSMMMQMDRIGAMRSWEGRGPMMEIPDSGHHVMLDQPLALVTAVDGMLQGWPR